MLFGIDISTWQKSSAINYDKIAAQVDFVILRLGYTGSSNGISWAEDAEFRKHYKEFSARNVPIGVYWYSRADTPNKGVAEAETVLSLIKGLKLEYPIWWDTEDTVYQAKASRQVLTDTAKAFCSTIEKAGYYTGIYASTSWLNTRLDMSQLKDFDVWVAQYNTEVTYTGRWGMWQYTSKGRLDGYVGDLDFNKSTKNYKDIITKAGLNHLPAPAPIPTPVPVPVPVPTPTPVPTPIPTPTPVVPIYTEGPAIPLPHTTTYIGLTAEEMRLIIREEVTAILKQEIEKLSITIESK